MKIFISWSGTLSHAVARALNSWLPQVINAAKPWISSEDIDKGTRWFSEIGSTLAESNFGIVCLTKSNLSAPWILFEAGALSKSLDQARVSPLLIDLNNADIQGHGPLTQFNTTSLTQDDIKKLVTTINSYVQEEQRRTRAKVRQRPWTMWTARLIRPI